MYHRIPVQLMDYPLSGVEGSPSQALAEPDFTLEDQNCGDLHSQTEHPDASGVPLRDIVADDVNQGMAGKLRVRSVVRFLSRRRS
jgi:hypothetical protein